jgi:hypothetical protein
MLHRKIIKIIKDTVVLQEGLMAFYRVLPAVGEGERLAR